MSGFGKCLLFALSKQFTLWQTTTKSYSLLQQSFRSADTTPHANLELTKVPLFFAYGGNTVL
jgi:hypothetical protein